jgi:hypothetical protein
MNIGFPAVFLLIRLLAHTFAPRANPPAGGDQIFVILVAGFSSIFGYIVATTVGCTAGSRDLTEGNVSAPGRDRPVPAGAASGPDPPPDWRSSCR